MTNRYILTMAVGCLLALLLGAATVAKADPGAHSHMVLKAYCMDTPNGREALARIKLSQQEDDLDMYQEVMLDPTTPCIDFGYYENLHPVGGGHFVEVIDEFPIPNDGCMQHVLVENAGTYALSWMQCKNAGETDA